MTKYVRGELLFYEGNTTGPYLCAYGHGLNKKNVFDMDGEEIGVIWNRLRIHQKGYYLKKHDGYVRLVRDFIEESWEFIECKGPRQGAMPVTWFDLERDECSERLFNNTIFLIWFLFGLKRYSIHTCPTCGKQIYFHTLQEKEFVTQFGCLQEWRPEVWNSMPIDKVSKLEVEWGY